MLMKQTADSMGLTSVLHVKLFYNVVLCNTWTSRSIAWQAMSYRRFCPSRSSFSLRWHNLNRSLSCRSVRLASGLEVVSCIIVVCNDYVMMAPTLCRCKRGLSTAFLTRCYGFARDIVSSRCYVWSNANQIIASGYKRFLSNIIAGMPGGFGISMVCLLERAGEQASSGSTIGVGVDI